MDVRSNGHENESQMNILSMKNHYSALYSTLIRRFRFRRTLFGSLN